MKVLFALADWGSGEVEIKVGTMALQLRRHGGEWQALPPCVCISGLVCVPGAPDCSEHMATHNRALKSEKTPLMAQGIPWHISLAPP